MEDIHCRWQKAYSVYCYSDGQREITQRYKKIALLQHFGISIKKGNKFFQCYKTCELKCNKYPTMYLNDGEIYNNRLLNKILNIHKNIFPICWNYTTDEYPADYRKDVSQEELETMTYSQECCDNSFDSDGEIKTDTRLSYNMTIASVNTKQNKETTNAMIVNKLREILNYFPSKENKSHLYKMLCLAGDDAYRIRMEEINTKSNMKKCTSEYESIHLPLDVSKKSTQISYNNRRNNKSK